MPAMYPEELRRLREQNPGLQYDFRGNLIDDGGYGTGLEQQFFDQMYGPIGDQIRNAYYGTGNLLNGSPQQQWWDPNGELAQQGLGALVSGQDLPDVGFYSQWNPDTNSWVRHGAPSSVYRQPGSGRTARPRNPYVQRQTPAFGGQMVPPEVRYQQDGGVDPAYQADLLRQTQRMPFMQSARRAAGNAAFFGDPANETFPNLAYQQE